MKGGQTPIHFMRWAPSDYVNDPWVKLAASRNDTGALAFYHLFLNHSFMEGGHLPSDAELLAGVLGLTASTVRKALAYWSAKECGLILIKAGQAWNPRVRRDVTAELKLRRHLAKLGKEGGKKAGKGRPLSQLRPPPIATIASPSPSPTPSPTPAPSPTRQANPHVDRDALVREGHRLLGEIAVGDNLDPTEVISKASNWNGRSYVRLDTMPDDRLAHTVNALRRWRRRQTGEPEPSPPENQTERAPPTNKARARQETAEAMIRGGLLDHQRSVGGRTGGPGGVLLERGADPGDGDAPGKVLPTGSRVPER